MTSRLFSFFLLFLTVGAWCEDGSQPERSLSLIQKYIGSAKMPTSNEMDSQEREPLVIRSQEEFLAFVALLPPREFSKMGSPAPNKDPLLKKPFFDWDRMTMLVVFDPQTVSFPPRISQVTVKRDQVLVQVHFADNKDVIEAKPLDIGSYTAVLVEKTILPALFVSQGTSGRWGVSPIKKQ